MKQAKVPTEGEYRRLLAAVQQGRYAARNRVALMLSYYAGLRVGEIAGLTIGDIFDVEGRVRDQIRLNAEITKGGHARIAFVNDKLSREIERYKAELGDRLSHRDRALLTTQRGAGFSANTLCQLLGQIYRAAGIDGGSSHSGRRWFITRLAHSGVSAKVIMTLAGHKHLTTTQRYIDVNDEMMRAAVDIL